MVQLHVHAASPISSHMQPANPKLPQSHSSPSSLRSILSLADHQLRSHASKPTTAAVEFPITKHDAKYISSTAGLANNYVSFLAVLPTSSKLVNNNGRWRTHNGLTATATSTPALSLRTNLTISALQRLSSSSRHIASTLCNALENLISINMQSNTLHNLQGNFAPVADECPPLSCIVDGPLPDLLDGLYVRNGPNEQYKSTAPTHSSHPFDGDGMLHCVSFHGGQVTYCCRYVHTSRFLQEKSASQALFPKVFSSLTAAKCFVATAFTSLAILRHMLGLVDLTKGMGLANTGLVFHHGKLLALGEDDLPYALCIQANGDLVNLGRYKFAGAGNYINAMTSHPKLDKESGEMIFLSYNIFFQPHLTFFRMSPNGTLAKRVPISLQEPCMIHDFALTPHFIIFPETQLVFHPLHLVQGKAPIKCDAQKVQRFGVLPRNATDDSELRWFDVPGCNCFHILNSWEELHMQPPENIEISKDSLHPQEVEEIVLILPSLSSADDLLSGRFDKVEGTLTEVRLNLAKGKATQSTLLEYAKDNQSNKMNVEMGTMNENHRGVKNRYVYMGVLGSSSHSLSGLVKVDLKTRKMVACRMFDEDCYASEPMFVPASINSKEAQEDEGCLLCFLHHENLQQQACELLVLDAKSATLDIVASVKIPRRIPYGFHGLFIPRNTLGS